MRVSKTKSCEPVRLLLLSLMSADGVFRFAICLALYVSFAKSFSMPVSSFFSTFFPDLAIRLALWMSFLKVDAL